MGDGPGDGEAPPGSVGGSVGNDGGGGSYGRRGNSDNGGKGRSGGGVDGGQDSEATGMLYDTAGSSEVCPRGTEKTGRWTKEERTLFREGMQKYGKQWRNVASVVKTRSVVQTRAHWRKHMHKLSKAKGKGTALDGGGGPDQMDI